MTKFYILISTSISLLIGQLIGCSSTNGLFNSNLTPELVVANVTSYNDSEFSQKLSSRPLLNFISYSKNDIRYKSENREVVQLCRQAAEVLGFKTALDLKSCSNCIDVLTLHKFQQDAVEGASVMNCSTFYGSSYGSTSCSTFNPVFERNNRWIGLTMTEHGRSNVIHQIDGYSTGLIPSVSQVALEMCYAQFLDFPNRVERKIMRVSRGLQLESGQAK